LDVSRYRTTISCHIHCHSLLINYRIVWHCMTRSESTSKEPQNRKQQQYGSITYHDPTLWVAGASVTCLMWWPRSCATGYNSVVIKTGINTMGERYEL
jgi:hypothetical protein